MKLRDYGIILSNIINPFAIGFGGATRSLQYNYRTKREHQQYNSSEAYNGKNQCRRKTTNPFSDRLSIGSDEDISLYIKAENKLDKLRYKPRYNVDKPLNNLEDNPFKQPLSEGPQRAKSSRKRIRLRDNKLQNLELYLTEVAAGYPKLIQAASNVHSSMGIIAVLYHEHNNIVNNAHLLNMDKPAIQRFWSKVSTQAKKYLKPADVPSQFEISNLVDQTNKELSRNFTTAMASFRAAGGGSTATSTEFSVGTIAASSNIKLRDTADIEVALENYTKGSIKYTPKSVYDKLQPETLVKRIEQYESLGNKLLKVASAFVQSIESLCEGDDSYKFSDGHWKDEDNSSADLYKSTLFENTAESNKQFAEFCDSLCVSTKRIGLLPDGDEDDDIVTSLGDEYEKKLQTILSSVSSGELTDLFGESKDVKK